MTKLIMVMITVHGESLEEVIVESRAPFSGPLLFSVINNTGEGDTSDIRPFAKDCILN